MNKVFRVVYNQTTKTWQAVTEIAKSRSKTKSSLLSQQSGGTPARSRGIRTAIKSLLAFSAVAAWATADAQTVSDSRPPNIARPGLVIGSIHDGIGTSGPFTTNGGVVGSASNSLDCDPQAGTGRERFVPDGQWNRVSSESIAIGNPMPLDGSPTTRSTRFTVTCATGNSSIAIGNGALAGPGPGQPVDSSVQSISIGTLSKATGDQSVALGANVFATGASSIAIGGDDLNDIAVNGIGAKYAELTGDEAPQAGQYKETTASGDASIAIGPQTVASGALSTAVGLRSEATGLSSIAYGTHATANDDAAIALGNNADANGKYSMAFGTNANTGQNAEASISLGNRSAVVNPLSVAIGSQNLIDIPEGDNIFSFGNNILTVAPNSVFLGSSSAYTEAGDSTGGLDEVNEATVNNVTYGNFAGATPKGVVSVGDVGDERRLQNVAAGKISKESTDAINGSQLFALTQGLTDYVDQNAGGSTDPWNLNIGNNGPLPVKPGDDLTFRGENGLNITRDGNTVTFTAPDQETPESYSWNVQVGANDQQGTNIGNDGKVKFIDGNATEVTGDPTGGIAYNVKVDGSTIKVDGQGKLYAVDQGGFEGFTPVIDGQADFAEVNEGNPELKFADGEGTTAVNNDGAISFNVNKADAPTFEDGKAVAPEDNADGFVDGNTLVNAINESGWNNTVNGEDSQTVNPGETVNFVNGDGTTAERTAEGIAYNAKVDNETVKINDDGEIAANIDGTTIKLNDDGQLSAAEAEPWSYAVNGQTGDAVNPGDTVDFTSEDKTVNLSNAADGKGVDFGVNIDGDTIKSNDDGQLYVDPASLNIDTGFSVSTNKGDAAPVAAGDTVDFSPAGDDSKIVMDNDGSNVTFDLSDDAKESLNKADTALQNFDVNVDGDTTTTVGGEDGSDEINFVGGKGTTAVNPDNGDVGYDVNVDDETISVNGDNKLAVNTGDITTGDDGRVEEPENPNSIAKAGDVANAINNSSWNYASDEGDGGKVHPGDTVTFEGGNNINTADNGDGTITISTDDEVEFNKVNVGPVEITPDGIDAGDTKITNVAPGEGDNDAVNVKQLDDKFNEVKWTNTVNGAEDDEVTAGDTVDFVDGTGTKAERDGDNGIKYSVDVDDNSVYINGDGKLASKFNVQADGEDVATVDADNPLNIRNGEGTTVEGDENGIQVNVNKGNFATDDSGKAAPGDAPDGFVTATDVADAINNTGWNYKGDDGQGGLVNPGQELSVEGGTNIETSGADGKLTISTKPDVEFDSVKAGPVTIDGDGIDAGDTKITNVAEGQDDSDAVNVKQLNDTVGNAAWTSQVNGDSDVEVKSGDEVNFVDGEGTLAVRNDDDSITFNANVDGETIEVNGDKQLTVKIGDISTGDGGSVNDPETPDGFVKAGDVANAINNSGWNFATDDGEGGPVNPGSTVNFNGGDGIETSSDGDDVTIGLNQDSKDSLDKANTALQTAVVNVNGDEATTIDQDNNEVNFVNGDGTTATIEDGKDVAFNVVRAGVETGEDGTAQPGDNPDGFVDGNTFVNTVNSMSWNNTVNGEGAKEVKAGDNVDFANGDGTTAARNDDGSIVYNVNRATEIPVGEDGKVETPEGDEGKNFVDGDTLADAINSSGFNVTTKGDEGTKSLVKTGDTLDFDNEDGNIDFKNEGNNVVANLTDDVTIGDRDGAGTNIKPDGITITPEGGDNPVSLTTDGLDNGGNQIKNVDSGLGDTPLEEATGDTLTNGVNVGDLQKTAKDINDTIDAQHWNLQANDDTETEISNDDTVQFLDGKNIEITRDKGDVTVSTADDVEFDTVTADTVNAGDVNADTVKAGDSTLDDNGLTINDGPSVTKDGIDAADNKITNVADGTEDSDAVNLGQLNDSGWVNQINGEDDQDVKNGDVVNFVNGDGTTAERTDDGITFNVNRATDITVGDDGKVEQPSEEDGNNFVDGNTFAETVNSLSWNNTVNGEDKQDVKAGDNVNFVNGDGTTAERTEDGITYNVNRATDITVGEDGKVEQPGEEDGKNFVDGDTLAKTINEAGFNVTTMGDESTSAPVKAGDTVDFNNTDKNIEFTNDGSNVVANLTDDVVIGDRDANSGTRITPDNVTVADADGNKATVAPDSISFDNGAQGQPVTLGNNGLDNGMNQITNVASGLGDTALEDADGDMLNNGVNVGDLKNSIDGLTENGFGLKDENGEDFKQPLGTTAQIKGDDKNIHTAVVDNEDGSKAIEVSLDNNITVGDGDEPGTITVNGKDGEPGVSINGEDGSIGLPGRDGKDGLTINTADGEPGLDGEGNKPRISYTPDGSDTPEQVATLNDGLKFVGNDGNEVSRPLNTTLNVVGGLDADTVADDSVVSSDNLGVRQKGEDGLEVVMKERPTFSGAVINGKDGEPAQIMFTGKDGENGMGIGLAGEDGADGLSIRGEDGKDGVTFRPDGRISNVTEGTDPTDAVNVDQLSKSGWNLTTNGDDDSKFKVTPDSNVDLSNTDGNVAIANEDGDVTVDLTDDVVIGDRENETGTRIRPEGVTVADGDNTVNVAPDSISFENGAQGEPVTLGNEGLDNGGNQIKNVQSGVTDEEGNPVTDLADVPDSQLTNGVNVGDLKDESDRINDKIDAQHWNLQVNGQDETPISNDDTVQFLDGKNINITRDGNDITVATDDDVEFNNVDANTVKAGDTTLDTDGLTIDGGPEFTKDNIDAGGNQIHNVAPGEADDDAVNMSQLKPVEETANSAVQSFDVNVNGDSIATVDQDNDHIDFVDGEGTTARNDDGQVTFDVNKAGVTYDPETGKATEPTDPNGFVDGQSFTDTLNNLSWNNTVNGEDQQDVKAGDNVNFVNGDGTTAERTEDGITYNVNRATDITVGEDGKVEQPGEEDGKNFVDGDTLAKTINDSGFNLTTQGDENDTQSQVNPGDTLDFSNTDENIAFTNDGNNVVANLTDDVVIGDRDNETGTHITPDGVNVADADGNKVTVAPDSITFDNGAKGNPVTLGNNGLDNGNNQIINVDSGLKDRSGNPVELSKAEGDVLNNAVNVGDLQTTINETSTDAFGLKDENGEEFTQNLGTTAQIVGDGNNLTTSVVDGTNGSEKAIQVTLNDDVNLGRPGKDGKDGVDGHIGVNGKDGSAVAINGEDGSIGLNGADGKDGISIKGGEGAPGLDGKDGKNRLVVQPVNDRGNPNGEPEEVATLNDGLNFVGNDGRNVARPLNSQLKVLGGLDKDTVRRDDLVTGENLGVRYGDDDTLEVVMKDTPRFSGLNVQGKDAQEGDAGTNITPDNGITVTDNDGKQANLQGNSLVFGDENQGSIVTQSGIGIVPGNGAPQVALTVNGLDNGDNQIRNVASGVTDKDGNPVKLADVTGDQLHNGVNVEDLQNSIADVSSNAFGLKDQDGDEFKQDLGTTAQIIGDNNLTTNVVPGTNGSENAIQVSLNDDISVGTPGADGKDGKDGRIGVNGADGSAVVLNGKDGSIGLNGADGKDGISIRGEQGEPGLNGTDGKTRLVVETQDPQGNPVTEDVATLNDGLLFKGNVGDAIARPLNSQLDIVGGINDKDTLAADSNAVSSDNLGVRPTQDGNGLEVVMKERPEFSGVTVNGRDGKDPEIKFAKDGKDGMSITGIDGADGKPGLAIRGADGKDGVTFTDDGRITNLTPGEDGTDAVNKDQLDNVANTANRGWDLTTNGDDNSLYNVEPGDKVDFSNEDGNVAISNEDGNVKVNLAKDILIDDGDKAIELNPNGYGVKNGDKQAALTADSLAFGNPESGKGSEFSDTGIGFFPGEGEKPVTLGVNGLDNGDNQIKNVASGVTDANGQPVNLADVTGDQLNNGVNVGDLQTTANNINNRIDDVSTDAYGLKDEQGKEFKQNLGTTARVIGDDNINTNVVEDDNGSALEVSLAKDVKADSFTAGDNVFNGDGLTIGTDGPSVTKDGINAGGNVISNVAPGEADDDAVNVSQLKDVKNVADSALQTVDVNVNGDKIATIDKDNNQLSFVNGNGTTARNDNGQVTFDVNRADVAVGPDGKVAQPEGDNGTNFVDGNTLADAVNNASFNVTTNGSEESASPVKAGDTVNFTNQDGNIDLANEGNEVKVNLSDDVVFGDDKQGTEINRNGVAVVGTDKDGNVKQAGLTADSLAFGNPEAGKGAEFSDTGIGFFPGNGEKPVTLGVNGLNNGGNQIKDVQSGLNGADGQPVKLADATGDMLNNGVNVGDLQTAAGDINSRIDDISTDAFGLKAEDGKDFTQNLGTTAQIVGDGNLSTSVVDGTEDGTKAIQVALNNNINLGKPADGNGENGEDGAIAVNGKDGSGVYISGKDGAIGLAGKNGANGLAIKGDRGEPGLDGINGVDGADAEGKTRITYQPVDNQGNPEGDPEQVATLQDGLNFVGNDNQYVARKLNSTLHVVGGINDADALKADSNAVSSDNLGVRRTAEGTGLEIVMKERPEFSGVTVNGRDGKDPEIKFAKDGKDGMSIAGIDGEDGKPGLAIRGADGKDGVTFTPDGRITNVTPGKDGTDAVNKDQLDDVAGQAAKGWNLTTMGDESNSYNVKPGDTVDFANQDGNIVVDHKDGNVSVNLADDVVFGDDKQGTEINRNGLGIRTPEGKQAALTGDSLAFGNPDEGKGAEFSDTGIGFFPGEGEKPVTLGVNGLNNGGNQIKDVQSGLNGPDGQPVNLADADGDMLTNGVNVGDLQTAAGDINSRIDNFGWNVQANDQDPAKVGEDDTVKFLDGKNISISSNDRNITIATNDDVEFNTVKAGDVTANSFRTGDNGPSMTTDGINAGGKNITNVAAGVNDDDAVNFGQLKDFASKAGGKDTSATVESGNEDLITVSKGDAFDNNGIETTPFTVDLSDKAKDSLNNADSALQTVDVNVNGEKASTIDKDNNQVNFVDGKGTTARNDNGNVTFDVNTAKVDVDENGKVVQPEGGNGGFVDGDTLANAVNNAGFNLTTNGDEDSKSRVKAGDTVDFSNQDGNIVLANDGNKVAVNLADDVVFGDDKQGTEINRNGLGIRTPEGNQAALTGDSLAFGTPEAGKGAEFSNTGIGFFPGEGEKPVTLGVNGLNNGGNQIKDVQSGLNGADGQPVNLADASGDMLTNGVNVGDLQTAAGDINKRIDGIKGGTFGLKDDDGDLFIQDNGTAAQVVGDRNISTNVVDGEDGNKALQVGLADQVTLGTPAAEGTEGTDGALAVNGKDGAGVYVSGRDGQIGMRGKDGEALAFGAERGRPDLDGVNGVEGADPDGKTRILYQPVDENGDPVGDKEHVATLNDGLNFVGNDDQKVARKLNSTLDIKGGMDKDMVLSDQVSSDNLGVRRTADGNGLEVVMKDNPEFTGVFVGPKGGDGSYGTEIAPAGVAIKTPEGGQPVTLTGNGLDNGGNRIRNVAPGIDGTDAVNVDQLNDAIGGATGAGWNLTTNGDEANSYKVQPKSTVDFSNQDGNIVVDHKDGNVSVNLANDITLENPEQGKGIEINPDGIAIKDGDKAPVTVTGNGLDNGGNRIKNVGDGVEDSDGVNLGQLKQFAGEAGKGLDFEGDIGDKFNRAPGSTVTLTGGVTDPDQLTEGNIGVVADPQQPALEVKLSKDLNGLNSVEANHVKAGDVNTGSLNAGGTVVNGNGVTIPAANGDPANTVSLTQGGLNNGGQTVSNIAPGVYDNDAASVGQLKDMGNQLNYNMRAMGDALSDDINRVDNNARAGIASALASANLPFATTPNEKMVSVGGGVYRGEAGYAVSASAVSENGKWVIKGTASGDSRNNWGGAGGVGYRWW